jgi:hypothetical protein
MVLLVEPLVTRDASGSTFLNSGPDDLVVAVPTASGGGRRGDRTPDILLVRQALYR